MEYEYALEAGKPLFAIVLSDDFITAKVRKGATTADLIEQASPDKLKRFREVVLSKLSAFANDEKDIRLEVSRSIRDLEQRHEFSGWIPASETTTAESPGIETHTNTTAHEQWAALLKPPFEEVPAMRQARDQAIRLAKSDLPILIEGEPGTGRRTLAAALTSQRASQGGTPIVTFDGLGGLTASIRELIRRNASVEVLLTLKVFLRAIKRNLHI